MKKQVGLAVSISLLAFGAYAQSGPAYVPGSAESVGLRRIVPDTLVWFNVFTMLPQIQGFVAGQDAGLGGALSRHDKPRERGGSRKTQNSLQELSGYIGIPPGKGWPPPGSEFCVVVREGGTKRKQPVLKPCD